VSEQRQVTAFIKPKEIGTWCPKRTGTFGLACAGRYSRFMTC